MYVVVISRHYVAFTPRALFIFDLKIMGFVFIGKEFLL